MVKKFLRSLARKAGYEIVNVRNPETGVFPQDFDKEAIQTVLKVRAFTVTSPERILRLDTDFYESTRHELIHLYPRLSEGGVLIIDDYGSPEYVGSKRAVDEYIEENRLRLLLNRIDADGRLAVKVSGVHERTSARRP